jgi:histidinol-phosphate aminotransferase
MRKLGFVAVDSHANFTWNTHPRLAARTLYEELKRNRILVRYMNYTAWGDGLRISIGTDAEMEQCLSVLKEFGVAN